MRAVLPCPPSSSTVARRGARQEWRQALLSAYGAAAARASELVRIAETRSNHTADTDVSQRASAHRGRASLRRGLLVHHLCSWQQVRRAGARARREALAAVLTASLALLRRKCVTFATDGRHSTISSIWLVSYVPLAPVWHGIAGLGGVHPSRSSIVAT